MLKLSLLLVLALVTVLILPDHESLAFAPVVFPSSSSSPTSTAASSSALAMGLFDAFSKEAREERERKKRMVVEEQERMQKEIMDRRRNPEKMDEYEYQTQVRRELRMEGKDEEADAVTAKIYEGSDDQTLLNGAKVAPTAPKTDA